MKKSVKNVVCTIIVGADKKMKIYARNTFIKENAHLYSRSVWSVSDIKYGQNRTETHRNAFKIPLTHILEIDSNG